MKQSVPPSDPGALQREIELLRERLADKDGVIDDLRQRLDTEAEERRRTQAQLTALLTDQRPKPEETPKRRSWCASERGENGHVAARYGDELGDGSGWAVLSGSEIVTDSAR